MNLIKTLIFYLFILASCQSFSQTIVDGTSYTQFQIKMKNDSINFVIADTNLTVKKPLLLFCQGSLPVPLFIKFDSDKIWPTTLSNFNLKELNRNYHVAVISMPKTPVVVTKSNLNPHFNYVPDTTKPYNFSEEFTKADYLENYISRANKVLKYLKKQKWIASEKMVIAGHSQGGQIAVQIARQNKKITQLGLFGVNPFGRVDISVRKARLNAHLGKTTWEEADSLINQIYKQYEDLYNPDSLHKHPELKGVKSFSKPFYKELSELDIPIYVAYGTEDRIADLCDLIPIYFIEKGKNNLTLKRYIRQEHNFFMIDENGITDYNQPNWKSVMSDFIKWAE